MPTRKKEMNIIGHECNEGEISYHLLDSQGTWCHQLQNVTCDENGVIKVSEDALVKNLKSLFLLKGLKK